ncbi:MULTISPECIES: family 1 glycosylhydrolase [unclassified Rathayibacter]|uniref:family 1 glycosylhydrolase n=1 Tax=unclassified Rathayibacter TaxID=2609250 RepID=UPI001404B083|nr:MULTISPECIES: family 1 glycosylhydrolase [unclassified Rathayibacter]
MNSDSSISLARRSLSAARLSQPLPALNTDIDLLDSLRLTSFRCGIKYARIEPTRCDFPRAEPAHERAIIQYCLAQGIEPVVTLHHFSSALSFAMSDGWSSEAAVGRFGERAEDGRTGPRGRHLRRHDQVAGHVRHDATHGGTASVTWIPRP